MDVFIEKSNLKSGMTLKISGSKSETNRLLILQKLFGNIQLYNSSDSDDSEVLYKALNSNEKLVDIHHAGTAMRFLTAYYSMQPCRETILTGSKRMCERPIGVLVDALRNLGAQIDYLDKEGYPPLRIIGNRLKGGRVKLSAGVSSQYISALLLIAPFLETGIELELSNEIISMSYIEMTLSVLKEFGIPILFEKSTIKVESCRDITPRTFEIESDRSSASYYYAMVALSPIGTNLRLGSYKLSSLQGDSQLVSLFQRLGVKTIEIKGGLIEIIKERESQSSFIANLSDTPDLAQTLSVCCFGLGIECVLTGLQTLKIKETDRLVALNNELKKLGAEISITQNSLYLSSSKGMASNVTIETYQDHRMAMSFAPLALLVPLIIKDSEVVTKSYKNFWKDIEKLGFVLK